MNSFFCELWSRSSGPGSHSFELPGCVLSQVACFEIIFLTFHACQLNTFTKIYYTVWLLPKRQNELEMAFCLFILKLDWNFQVLKNYRFPISTQRHISAWSVNCQESNPGLRRNIQPPWPITCNKPNTQVRECCLFMYMKPFRSAEWWTLILQSFSPMVEIPFPDISSSKTQSVDLFCFSILRFISVQSFVI